MQQPGKQKVINFLSLSHSIPELPTANPANVQVFDELQNVSLVVLLIQKIQPANGKNESSPSEESCFLICTQTEMHCQILYTLLDGGGTLDKCQFLLIRSMHRHE